jgi:hypothetical protein
MKPQIDPARWTDDTSLVPDDVRGLVNRCRDDHGTSEQVERLRAVLGPVLWPIAPGGVAKAPVASETTVAALGKAVALVALASAAAAGVWFGAAHHAPHEEPAPSVTGVRSAAVPSRPASEPPLQAAPAVAAPPSPEAPRVLDGGTARSNRGSSASAGTEATNEAWWLDQAQAELASDPARALAATAEHRRRFPHGVLAQEREVIAIEALQRLGRQAEARARGARFFSRFPDSAYREKVRSVIGDP